MPQHGKHRNKPEDQKIQTPEHRANISAGLKQSYADDPSKREANRARQKAVYDPNTPRGAALRALISQGVRTTQARQREALERQEQQEAEALGEILAGGDQA